MTGPMTVPDWRDDAWTDRFPRLTVAERDRRLAMARRLMDDEDLGCLVLASPSESHDVLGHYFTDEARPTVVLPRHGDPVAFQDGVTSPDPHRDLRVAAELAGDDRWVTDWRINEGPRGIAGHLRRTGLADTRIGCTGRATMWPTTAYIVNGGAPWNELPTTHEVRSMLPGAEFVDVWAGLLPRMAVKSAEEIAQYAKAAHLAERAARIYLDGLRGGDTQADAMARAAFDVFAHGGFTPTGGLPFTRTRPPVRGDVLTCEIIVYVGGMEAQACLTACIGRPGPTMTALIDAAHESYDRGLAAIRPGLRMRELQAVVEPPFRRIGAWGTPPLFHGLNPIYTQAEVGVVNEEDTPGLRARFFPDHAGDLPSKPVVRPDLALAPGMIIHLEPNGQRGRDNVFIGGDLLVTADGVEEFSASSRRVHILDGADG